MSKSAQQRRTEVGQHLAQLQRQNGRCFLTGVLLTPDNVYGILETPRGELKAENLRWVERDVGRLVDGIGVERALELAERILRFKKPELFRDGPNDNS